MLAELLPKRKLQPVQARLAWTLGRLGSRVPLYGPLNTIINAQRAADWLTALMKVEMGDPSQSFSLMQLARRTGDRYRDPPESLRHDVVRWLQQHQV